MKNIPTARSLSSGKADADRMIEFARLHVEAALEAALNNARITMKPGLEYYYEDYVEGISPESILESYPLNNIK